MGGSGVIEEDTKPPIDLNNLAHNPVVYPSEDGQHISTLPGGMYHGERMLIIPLPMVISNHL